MTDGTAIETPGAVLQKAAPRGRWKPYPGYRDSGVEWLGEIPWGWEVCRLKHVARCRASNVDKRKSDDEEPVRLCNYTDVYYNERITDDLELMEATASAKEIERFSLRRGDVLITKDSESWKDIAVPAWVPADLDGVLCGYHLAQLRPLPEQIRADYLFRCLESKPVNSQFRVAATGITRYGLPIHSIQNALLTVPPREQQTAITALIDRETARIDALVANKLRLIELLQEKRTTFITHAVTRGLRPDVPLRNSDVEWLGEIPTHWIVLPLSRATLSKCDGPFGSGLKSEHYSETGVRVIRLQNVGWAEFLNADRAFIDARHASKLGDHSVIADDLLVAGLGDDGHPVGRACVAPPGIEPAMVKADCFRFRLDPRRVVPSFAAYQLSATALAAAGSLATGSTRARMNLSTTANRRIALPSLSEQRSIVEALDRLQFVHCELVDELRAGIRRLKELRAALISAAVTGKIDVREEAA